MNPNRSDQGDEESPLTAPEVSPEETEEAPPAKAVESEVKTQGPEADEAVPAKDGKRLVTQEDLDRCYAKLDPILGMSNAANWLQTGETDELQEAELVDRADRQRTGGRKRILGIDIGETSIKLVQLGLHEQILSLDVAPLEEGQSPEAKDQAIIQAIREMIDRNKIKTRKAVLCLSEKCSHMRTAQLSSRTKTELQTALAREVDKLELPGQAEKYVFNHMVFENEDAAPKAGDSAKPSLTGLFFSTEREAVLRVVRIAKGAKLKPVAIDIDALASARFYRQAYQRSDLGTTVLAEMHAGDTLLSFVEGDRLVWAKHLSTGSHEFTASIAEALRIDKKQAESLKRGEWKGAAAFKETKSDVVRAIEPVLNRLSGEIRRTVQFYLSQSKARRMHRLVLAGTGSRIPGLAKDLTRLLELPVVRWGNTSRFNFSAVNGDEAELPDKLSRFAVALGLCLWEKNADSLNLLPGPWTRMMMLKKGGRVARPALRKLGVGLPDMPKGGPVFIAGAVVLVLLGLVTLFYTKNQGLKIRLEKEQALLQDWNPIREDLERLRALRHVVAEKKDLVKALRARQVRLSTGIAAFSVSVPQSVSLSAIRFEDALFKVNAYALNAGAVETFIDHLNQSESFTEPVLNVIRKVDDFPGNTIYFEVKFGLADALD